MRRALSLVVGGVLVGAGLAACGHGTDRSDTAASTDDTAHWSRVQLIVPSDSDLVGEVAVTAATRRVTVSLTHALVAAIPAACTPSTTVRRHSYIVGGRLVCDPVPGADRVDFQALTLGGDGDQVRAAVTTSGAGSARRTALPARTLLGGVHRLTPDLRLISSPDFLNADIGDLAQGPTSWTPGVSTNATNEAYRRAITTVMNGWAALHPAAVLVAGDLVDGRWGYDDHHTGIFGPVHTPADRKQAVRRAARTFYPQWKQRFADHHLTVFPAPGDHEYGDNPWPRRKRDLAATFRSEFARAFTSGPGFRSLSHPDGQAAGTAYAGRPAPDVQVISLDEFDITPARARLGLDADQLRWLRHVLAKAQRDHVRWIVVQGHVPVLYPVPERGSSALHYPGGARSPLWRLFERYGVDLYLDGEVHDTSMRRHGGVVQLAHGGAFQFGLTTSAVLDFYGDRLLVTIRDDDVRHRDVGPRLWETRRAGVPREISVHGPTYTIGSMMLRAGHVTASSGILAQQ